MLRSESTLNGKRETRVYIGERTILLPRDHSFGWQTAFGRNSKQGNSFAGANDKARQVYGFTATTQGSRTTGACDTVLGTCQTFGYDEFNRLQSVSGTPQTYNYVYDRYGNRSQQNAPQGGLAPNFLFDPATNRINQTDHVYDVAGNLINDGFHAYKFDAEGNVLTVDAGATASYTYDALRVSLASFRLICG